MSLILPKTCSMGSSKTGLVGTIGLTLLNPDGTVHTARATTEIYEIGGGCYGKNITFPDNWEGSLTWDTGGGTPVYACEEYGVEGLLQEVKTELTTHDTKLDTVDGLVDRILKATEVKQCIITDASATTLSFTTNLTETSNQFWKRGVILITSGNNEGQIRTIENYNGSTKAITIKTALDTAPAQNDTFIILTERKYLTPDIEDIIGAVWDEPMADHVADGSTGNTLDFIKNIENGKWQIVGNQMIFTKADNTTEVCRFNLFDSLGNPAETNIYKRERV